jgi:hypothetical protein
MHTFSLTIAICLSIVYDLPEKEETIVGVNGKRHMEDGGIDPLIVNLST